MPYPRKPTNLSLDSNLLAEAKSLGINLSRAAETGVRDAVSKTKTEIWRRENGQALESSNKYATEHRQELKSKRQF